MKKVLVANRGEIAVRVIRACRELGIRSVAVYSDADRDSPHLSLADEAYGIGPPPASRSYLRADALVDLARRSGCDAVHPGYGFLAEQAHFAEMVTEAGLVFVGPPASAIASMGDKTEARRRMIDAGVPVVPGTTEPLADAAEAAREAARIGVPVMLKAAAGGGGKGMRIVSSLDELPRAFEAAAREAQSAFGDARLYLEKLLDRPRHVEVQILADEHGRVIALGERECSVQRRHQKMIEEAPSPAVTPALRQRISDAAISAARAVRYTNAGTIEFLLCGDAFYFLEMNTRIQVEHPVTELTTGIDLVQWQLRVAAGEPLPFGSEDISLSGHAIECRITSEDALAGFLPSVGRIVRLQIPSGPGVRWDGGVVEGQEISLFYDSLIGKLIVHAPDRASAVARMRRALAELEIMGVDTSAPFHRAVMQERDFNEGRIDIGYVEHHPGLTGLPVREDTARIAALVAALLEDAQRRIPKGSTRASPVPHPGWHAPGWLVRSWRDQERNGW